MGNVGNHKTSSTEIKYLIVAISIALFIIAPFVSYAHRNTGPTYTVMNESPIEGSIGFTVSKTQCTPQTSIVIYNGTVNDAGADWSLEFGLSYRSHDEPRGVMLELDGNSTYGSYILDSRVVFVGHPTFPLMNYSDVSFSVSISVLQGSANVSLQDGYYVWPDDVWHEGEENSTHFEAGQSEKVTLKPNLTEVYSLSSGWAVRTSIIVDISSSEKTQILIGDVVISVISNESLFPVTFDIQAPDGESLFLNPYMRSLRHAYPNYDIEGAMYPGVELTRTGNASDSSIFGPRITNETLFLAEGNYEGTTGWFYKYGYKLDSVFNISFVVGFNESVFVTIKIPVIRLFIDIYPSFAYSRVIIIDGYYTYVVDYPLQDAEYLYMPNRTSFGIIVSPLIYEGYRFVDYAHYDYRLPTAYIYVHTNGTSYVRASVRFAQFSLFGVILDWGQILGISGAVLLLLLLIHEGVRRSFAGARTDYGIKMGLLPVSLYYIAMFFPWVTYSFSTHATTPTEIFGEVMVPLFTTLWWNPQSQLTPAPSSYLITYFYGATPASMQGVIAIVYLFWLPVIYLSYLIATRGTSIDKILFGGKSINPISSIAILVGPFSVGCLYLWYCLIGLCLPSIGLIAVLMTLPSWAVALLLRKHYDRSSITRVDSQKHE